MTDIAVTLYNGRAVDHQDEGDIAASLAGDEEAFARLVRRHTPAVTSLLWRFTRDRGRCEELVQETFVEAFFSLRRYRGRAPLESWLRRIATRVGYRYWRNRDRAGSSVPLAELEVAAPEAEADPALAAQIVHALLARLPAAERLVLTLLYFDNCDTREIAARMGWTRAMVKVRAYRARRRLRAIARREHLLEKFGWTS